MEFYVEKIGVMDLTKRGFFSSRFRMLRELSLLKLPMKIARPYFLNEPVSLAHTITLLPLARLVTLYQRFNILRLGKAQVNLFSLNFSPFRVYPPHFHTMLSLPYQEALPSMAGCNCAWHRPGDRIAHNIAPRQAIQADLRHARVLCRIWL